MHCLKWVAEIHNEVNALRWILDVFCVKLKNVERTSFSFHLSYIDGQEYQSLSFNRSPIRLIFSIGKRFVQTTTIHYKFNKCFCLHFLAFYWSNLHSQRSLNLNVVVAGSGKNTFENNNPRQQQRILQLYRCQCGLCENWCRKFCRLQSKREMENENRMILMCIEP